MFRRCCVTLTNELVALSKMEHHEQYSTEVRLDSVYTKKQLALLSSTFMRLQVRAQSGDSTRFCYMSKFVKAGFKPAMNHHLVKMTIDDDYSEYITHGIINRMQKPKCLQFIKDVRTDIHGVLTNHMLLPDPPLPPHTHITFSLDIKLIK
jgi:hypothetical protein